MSTTKPENLIISDETMAEYEAWLKKLNEIGGRRNDEEITSLFSMTICKLLASDQCVNELNCATCPAARETFTWAREKIKRDGITYTSEFFGSAYNEYPGLGKMDMSSEAINTHNSHIIHFGVHDGLYEEKGQQGMVTVHVS